MTTHVIVGCGKAKAPGELPARDKYTSSYFIVKREFADVIGDDWSVYSAKFGLIRPDRVIDDYDVKAEDVDDDVLRERVEDTVDVIPDDTDKVVVCAGSDYADPVREFLIEYGFDHGFTVDFFFDGTDGMFDQQSKMKTVVNEAKNEDISHYV